MIFEKWTILPNSPGCYLMKNGDDEVIYIGKAKKLKSRVSQYFSGVHDGKTQKMISQIADFDVIVTESEKEALLLEINLIKQYRPRYNIMFMDDKTYPYLKIPNEPYPRLQVVRERKKDKKAQYFGPYPDVKAARDTERLLNDLYPLRKCTQMPKKVCLYYHIKQCLGPCQFPVDQAVYKKMTDDVARFIKGDIKEQINQLQHEMNQAIEQLAFEKAAEIRDLMVSIENTVSKQQVQIQGKKTQDVFALVNTQGFVSIVGFFVRDGKLIQKVTQTFESISEPYEALDSFLIQFYQQQPKPQELILDDLANVELLAEILQIKVTSPQRGVKANWVKMAQRNALQVTQMNVSGMQKEPDFIHLALSQLAKISQLDEVERIECFDNSHTAGTFTVAGMVVFEHGKPKKSDYRRYRLHSQNNDVESMKEVLYRRLQRALKENSVLPDIILVDGGLQQVNAAKEIKEMLHCTMPIFGLAKDAKHNTAALITETGSMINLLPQDGLSLFLGQIQDEVHRFAISYHRQLRQKAMTQSVLDEIVGIGPQRKQQLLTSFGSLKGIRQANQAQLAAVIGPKAAQQVIQFFKDMQEETYE